MMQSKTFYVEAIRELFEKNQKATYEDVMQFQTDYYEAKIVSDNDRNLIKIAFTPELTQVQLDEFLSGWDIEVAGSNKALLLSYVMRARPDLDFGRYTGPRLKGLINFFRFGNLQLIAKYTKIIQELNRHGIEPMILKGGAMKFLRPELSRTMGDIDILVSSSADYELSKKIIREMGFEFADNEHSIDVHEKGQEAGLVDIHLFIDMVSDYDWKVFNARLFKSATRQTIFSTAAYLPSDEDLYFMALVNLARNLRDKTSVAGILYTLFDLDWLQHRAETFDWQRIRDNIRLTNTEPQVYLAIQFINKLRPNWLSSHELLNEKLVTNLRQRCNKDIFFALHVEHYKLACKKLRIGPSLKSWSAFKHYCRMKVPHFFLKRIYKSQRLIDWYLSR